MAAPTYYSQFEEDKWIVENLAPPPIGTFVDVGAWDGIEASNTYYFEKNGWSGLCIEPLPDAFETLTRNRRCECRRYAVASNASRRFYTRLDEAWLAGFDRDAPGAKVIDVATRRLDEILDEVGITRIDLLSIDVEGNELDVWSTFDHNVFRPEIVIIEFDTAGKQSNKDRVMEVFGPLPYEMCKETAVNLIFKRTN